MNRRTLLRAGAAAGLAALAGCATGYSESRFDGGFEDGLGNWTTGAHIGPEVPLEEFDWSIDVTDERAATGSRSLRVRNEGDYDDGTCWASHPIPVEPGRAYTASVTATFWSESESFNTLRNAVMRLGPEPPEAEEDFPDPGQNTTPLGVTPYGGLREPLHLAEGWREYSFEWTTPELGTDTLHVAVGTTVVWETEMTHYVDDVTVELTPR